MKVLLLSQRSDDRRDPSQAADDLIGDLGFDHILRAMANGDSQLFEVCQREFIAPAIDGGTIRYRQAILGDCIDHSDTVRRMHQLAREAIYEGRRVWRSTATPSGVLSGSLQVMEIFVPALKELRRTAEQMVDHVRSDGLSRLFRMLLDELDAAFFDAVATHLAKLRFRDGVTLSARVGRGNTGADYVLREVIDGRRRWIVRRRGSLHFRVDPRDDAGLNALEDLRRKGINEVGNALAQSADHVSSFFYALSDELAFYIGCLNLRDTLHEIGVPTCTPTLSCERSVAYHAEGIYDVALALKMQSRPVGNDFRADDCTLIVVTGANQGGKSTFLRALGQAQLMTQCGMFVGAERFATDVQTGVFVHFRREEDNEMVAGRFVDELRRMQTLVGQVTGPSLLLLNESFSSTNEREGSEVGRQVIRAFCDSRCRVVLVTHLFDLAQSLGDMDPPPLYLRARRRGTAEDFKLVPTPPSSTSYGLDVFDEVFGPVAPDGTR
jgi:hypothetical protein